MFSLIYGTIVLISLIVTFVVTVKWLIHVARERSLLYYYAKLSDWAIIALAFGLGFSGMFLTLAQLGAYRSKIISDCLEAGLGLPQALVVYGQTATWDFLSLTTYAGIAGLISALIFAFPLIHEARSRYVAYFDNGVRRLNELSYELVTKQVGKFDDDELERFTSETLDALMAITNAQFVVFSGYVDGHCNVRMKKGWTGKDVLKIDAPDTHALCFIQEHNHSETHSGPYSRNEAGVRVSTPSLGVKVMDAQDGTIYGIIWISCSIDKDMERFTIRLLKIAANMLSLGLMKHYFHLMMIGIADSDGDLELPSRPYSNDDDYFHYKFE